MVVAESSTKLAGLIVFVTAEVGKISFCLQTSFGPAKLLPASLLQPTCANTQTEHTIGDVHTGHNTRLFPGAAPFVKREKERNAYTLAESSAASNCSCVAAMLKTTKKLAKRRIG